MNSGTLETLGLKMVFRGVPPSPRLMRTTGQAYVYVYPCIVLGVLRWPGSAAVTAEVEQRLEEAEPNYLSVVSTAVAAVLDVRRTARMK